MQFNYTASFDVCWLPELPGPGGGAVSGLVAPRHEGLFAVAGRLSCHVVLNHHPDHGNNPLDGSLGRRRAFFSYFSSDRRSGWHVVLCDL